ncbi:MAG: hypothetical protein V2A62_02280 [Candidatus Woesearchaeota archaeon]
MKNYIILMIISVLLLSVIAVADLSADAAALSKELTGTKLTGVAGSMLKNEKVNVYVKDGEKTLILSLVTEDKQVLSLEEKELSNPTLKVFTDSITITAIQASPTPAVALKTALEDGRITYEAIGFWHKMKFGFSNFFVKMFGSGKEEANEVKKEVKEEKKAEKEELKEEKKDDKTPVKEEAKEVKEEEKKEEVITETVPPEIPEEKFHTYNISLTNTGFNPATLKIKVGDTVEWKVARSGNFKNGMILGTQSCIDIKSSLLKNGESFKWKFDKVQTCTIVDGIITTQLGKVVVE